MMKEHVNTVNDARVLYFSFRNLYRPEAWRCSYNEFERIVQEIDAVDVVSPGKGLLRDFRKKNAERIGNRTPVRINPGVEISRVKKEYDVFFVVCEKPAELLALESLKGWKEKCRISVCWLPEIWVQDLPTLKAPIRSLADFDHVLLNVARTVEPLSDSLGKNCQYLPAGVDTRLFCPEADAPARAIDVLSIGRRSEASHNALIDMARNGEIFYHYDTFADLSTESLDEHRFMVANLAKRSRYFIVNPGKVDSIGDTAGQEEFGYRYFEGAASGAVLVGDYPDSVEFRDYFGWEDSVIHVPFGSEQIGDVISDLDSQPDRLAHISRTNIVNSLRRHDWVYRWGRILDMVGLEAKPELVERKSELERMAKAVGVEGDWSPSEKQAVQPGASGG